MSLDSAKADLARFGRDGDVIVHDDSSHTVAEAAAVLRVEPGQIAKTISLYAPDGKSAILVVAAGDVKIANGPFKQAFGTKANMLKAEDVEPLTGHRIGGVCPFGNPASAQVWLDSSLRRYDVVYPAAGSANSTISFTLADLEQCSGALGWVSVTKSADTADE